MTAKDIEKLKEDWRYSTGASHWEIGDEVMCAKWSGSERATVTLKAAI